MVPAPMLARSPTSASPRYEWWPTFAPAARLVTFSSAKFPTWQFDAMVHPGRMCANGPTSTCDAMVEPSIAEERTMQSSPIAVASIREPLPIRVLAPMLVVPTRVTPGSITASAAISTCTSIHAVVGSISATPRSRCPSLMRSRSAAATSANWWRSFTPSSSISGP